MWKDAMGIGRLLVLSCLVLAACVGDDGVLPLDPAQVGLAGAWRASAFTVASRADPHITLDLVALGGTMTLSIMPSGAFTGTAVIPGVMLRQPGFVTVPLSGLVRVTDAHTMRIDFIPEVPPFFQAFAPTYTLDEHTLSFVDDDTRFDLDGDGDSDDTITAASLTRN